MTTEVQDELFEAFCRAKLPLYFTGTSAPADWPGGPKLWERDKQVAISGLRVKWAAQLELGFTARELAGLDPMPQIHVFSGRPVRDLEPTLPEEMSAQALFLLRQAASRNLALDPREETALDRASRGLGNPQTVEGIVAGVRNQILGHDAKVVAAQREADNRPLLHVDAPFRAKGNRHYAVGQHRISPEEALDLRAWQLENEAMAAQRGWPWPMGFDANTWPPFVLEGGPGLWNPRPADMWQGA